MPSASRPVFMLLAVLSCGMGSIASYSQEPPLAPGAPIVTLGKWATESWTGDDTPYRKIKLAIDRAVAKKTLTAAAMTNYERAADQSPTDPQAQFQWAYASFQAQRLLPLLPQKVFPWTGVFQRAPFPHSYEIARLAFLMETHGGGEPHLQSLGERLLVRNPADYDVEYNLVRCIDSSLSPQMRDKALAHANHLMHMRPKYALSYAALGNIYFNIWLGKNDRVAGAKAIKAYQEYLRLGPPDKMGRQTAEKLIKAIQQH